MPGGLVSVLILLPNLLWMLFPPRDLPKDDGGPADGLHDVMERLEWVGRIAAFVIPLFYWVKVQNARQASLWS